MVRPCNNLFKTFRTKCRTIWGSFQYKRFFLPLKETSVLSRRISQIYFVECVNKIKHILSVIHYTICGAVCFQFANSSCDDWENIYIYIYIYTLSYHHHQIGSMNYYPLFRVRSWTNGVRCMSFYILMGNDLPGKLFFMLKWDLVRKHWGPRSRAIPLCILWNPQGMGIGHQVLPSNKLWSRECPIKWGI